jgi:hypothetical protein
MNLKYGLNVIIPATFLRAAAAIHISLVGIDIVYILHKYKKLKICVDFENYMF